MSFRLLPSPPAEQFQSAGADPPLLKCSRGRGGGGGGGLVGLLACEQAFGGEGKAKRPVDKHLGPPFYGTRCASDPDASSYWREHRMLTGLIDIGFSVGT